MVGKLRIWKSLTNNIEEIIELDKKVKNYTAVKIDALPLNITEESKGQLIEDADIADDDILIIEKEGPN
jgi:hypothetical protein